MTRLINFRATPEEDARLTRLASALDATKTEVFRRGLLAVEADLAADIGVAGVESPGHANLTSPGVDYDRAYLAD